MIVQRLDRCETWREAIDERFDAEATDATRHDALQTHLDECADCRAYEDDLRSIRVGLRRLPDDPLPRETLERIWARTIDQTIEGRLGGGIDGQPTTPARTTRPDRSADPRPESPRPLRPFARVRVGLAVAAMLACTSIGAWLVSPPTTNDYTEEELARIDDDLRTAMAVLSVSLSEAEHIAIDEVLAGGTADALRHMPLSRDLQTPSNGG